MDYESDRRPLLPHSAMIDAREQELSDVCHTLFPEDGHGLDPFLQVTLSPDQQPDVNYLPDDLAGVEPTLGADCCITDIAPYLTFSAQVDFVNLEGRIFEKHQSRGGGRAKQRVKDGKVEITVTSDQAQEDIRHISVWVRREPKAAELFKDLNGEVELRVVCLEKKITHWVYRVDLDSVYDGPAGPVYQLARVDVDERNKFQLLVQVHFVSCENSDKVVSKPFLIRTQKKDVEKKQETRPGRPNRYFHTWSASSKRRAGEQSPSVLPVENPDSTTNFASSGASLAGTATPLDDLVVSHLDAQRANIDNLHCSTLNTHRGDIAYHMRLTDPDMCQNLQEGVVVGFFPDIEGRTQIAPLTSDNCDEAVMAGVISRSAYIQAHAPATKDEGKTDIVCVIGMVKVQIDGSVRSGERIYASTNLLGTAIPESHLPLRTFMTKNHTLLGMAMEGCKGKDGEINLVRCFVCIVLGINDKQLTSEVENIMDIMEMDIKAAINRFKKKTWKKMLGFVLAVVIFLGLLEFFLYEFIAPGTLLRYYLCKRGSMPDGQELKYRYNEGDEYCPVHGIQFTFDKIKQRFEDRTFKELKDSRGARYFLNLDRCAWGGKRDRSDLPGHDKPVCNGRVLAVYNATCSAVYKYDEAEWKLYNASLISHLKCKYPK